MTHRLYLTRTIHPPLRASGRDVLNSFGVRIAQATTSVEAEAIADMVNLAWPGVVELERRHDEAEAQKTRMVMNAKKREV